MAHINLPRVFYNNNNNNNLKPDVYNNKCGLHNIIYG